MGRRGLARRWTHWGRLLAALLLVGAAAAAGAWWLAAPALLLAVLTAFLPDLLRGWRTVGRFRAADRAAARARRLIAQAPPGTAATRLALRAYRDAAGAEGDDLGRLAGMRQAAQLAQTARREAAAAEDRS